MIRSRYCFRAAVFVDVSLKNISETVKRRLKTSENFSDELFLGRERCKLFNAFRVEDSAVNKSGFDLKRLDRVSVFFKDLSGDDGIRFARVGKIGLGVMPSLAYVEYLENIMRLPNDEGWKRGRML